MGRGAGLRYWGVRQLRFWYGFHHCNQMFHVGVVLLAECGFVVVRRWLLWETREFRTIRGWIEARGMERSTVLSLAQSFC